MKLLDDIRQKPLEFVVGVCILLIAVGGASLANVASTSLAIMFLLSLRYIREWRSTWASLTTQEKWLCYGFILFSLSGALSYINADDTDEFVKQAGRYVRFAMVISVYLMLRAKRLDVSRYFYTGIILSGYVFLGLTLYSLSVKPDMPASGHYHHITFGGAAMLNASLMGIILLTARRSWLLNTVVGVSMAGALYAALMSQARGVWIVLPVYLVIYIAYMGPSKKAHVTKLIGVGLVAALLLALSPVGGLVEKRYDDAVTEVMQFVQGEKFDTSVGGRLSMWDIAYKVWKSHPITGTGLGDFNDEITHYQSMGIYPEIEIHASAHNIFIQALVSTGLTGFVVLCFALLIAPLRLFLSQLQSNKEYALMGVLVILSYAVFGLTESWILRAPVISVFMAYTITISAVLMNSRRKADGE